MLYSFTVLGQVDGAGILSELSVQFQETHRCASRRSIKTGFPGQIGAHATSVVDAVAQQRLVFRGRQLQDGLTLYDSNIFDGAVVFLIGPRRVPAPLPPI